MFKSQLISFMEKILNKTCLMCLLFSSVSMSSESKKTKKEEPAKRSTVNPTEIKDQLSLIEERVKSAKRELLQVAIDAESVKATELAFIYKALEEALSKCYAEDPNNSIWMILFLPESGIYSEGSIIDLNNKDRLVLWNSLAEKTLMQMLDGEFLPKFSSAEELIDSSIAFWKDVIKFAEENPQHNAYIKSTKTYLRLFELIKFYGASMLLYAINDLGHCGDFESTERFLIALTDYILSSLTSSLTEEEFTMIKFQSQQMVFTFSKFVKEYRNAKNKIKDIKA